MRKIAIAVATLGLGAGLIAVSPAATAATSADARVLAGSITLYEHDDFGGRKASFSATDCNLANNYWGTGANRVIMNDQTSSMSNGRDSSVWLWQGAGKTGESYRAAANSADADLGNNPIGDNSVSCVEF
ncbi:peptidase inhibitor family I36 protein [Streptomyces brasiliscabiei]|uniref:peptidase inhibitor family I36 protein n=1 Tax=Streptomyces brasiliscabiei TaxID=2736302 RepID=UPI001C102D8B|nr:peptidase inhibitor family I36 protein [Streptomyces brasiliscabiei]